MEHATTGARDLRYRTCPLCEAMCGLELEIEGDRVARIRPDEADVWSKGFICPKGATIPQLHADRDRLRVPMVREGSTWREVSWNEALRRCEELLGGVLARYGKRAVSAYNIYSAGTVDQWPKNVSCMLMYGHMWWIPTPDVQRTHYWMILGGKPQASQGSLLACPDLLGEIERIRARGGRVVVVDPRRTGTASLAARLGTRQRRYPAQRRAPLCRRQHQHPRTRPAGGSALEQRRGERHRGGRHAGGLTRRANQ